MRHQSRVIVIAFSAAFLSAFGQVAAAQIDAGQIDAGATAKLDDLLGKAFNADTPGCAVGVRSKGATLERAYGSADLEHAILNTPDTIFESGSVAKQFTAMAILLLEQDGKLKTSDDIRKYLPEMPDYGAPITIENLITHTSGLRDWGSVAAAGGLPRGDRVFTQAIVLDILKRQKALNYKPGAEYSYTNSGYNLLAEIVARVSGASLQEFTATRMFKPLGMTHTQWRDDFNRIIKGRAMGYVKAGGIYEQSMPFMNVFGNGGLLTTVGDWLTWNDALTTSKLGAEVTKGMTKRFVLNSGRQIAYARGLMVTTYKGFNEIGHDGSTAGYTTWLVRYPDQDLSIALLCNTPPMSFVPHQVADIFLPAPSVAPAAPPVAATGLADPTSYAGTFANTLTGMPMTMTVDNGKLRGSQTPPLVRVGESSWAAGSGTLAYTSFDSIAMQPPGGEPATFGRVDATKPTDKQLADYAGTYASEEAEATYRITVEAGQLVLNIDRRPGTTAKLTPAYKDAFMASGRLIRFKRNGAGKLIAMSLGDGRMRDLNASRIGGSK